MNTINITNHSLSSSLIEPDFTAEATTFHKRAWYSVRAWLLASLITATSVLLALIARPEIIDSIHVALS